MPRWILLCATGAAVGLRTAGLGADVPAVPAYPKGAVVTNDIVAPIRLVVTDPVRTADLRQRELQKIPLICRHYTNVVDEVEAAFRADYASLRDRFLTNVERSFKRRAPDPQVLTNARFERFVGSFLKQNKSLLLTTNLLLHWVRGEAEDVLQTEWVLVLRAAMSGYIRADTNRLGARMGPQQVRMVPLPATNATLDLTWAESIPAAVNRSSLVSLAKVRSDLQNKFAPDQQQVARYLAAFLRPNCALDEELSQLSRDKRTEGLNASTIYEPGEVIARAGQIVDDKTGLALERWRAASAAERLKAKASTEKQKTRAAMLQVRREAVEAHFRAKAAAERNRWLMGAAGLLLAIAGGVTWRLYRVRRNRSLLPARLVEDPSGVTVIECPACSEQVALPVTTHTETWQERALTAEQRAERATAMLRAGVVGQLSDWLKRSLMQGLLSQRRQLLNTQQQALAEIEALEERLARVHAPLAERLRAYESRIAELEQQLAARKAENRELIEAQITLARRKLADAQVATPAGWN